MMLLDAAFWLMAVMYSLLAYLNGHQASHRVAVVSGQATLNPLLLFILAVYGWLIHPWLFLVWYGHKTIWWYAVGVLAIGFVFRLLWTKIGMATGAVRNAWAISLIGIPLIPVLLLFMVNQRFGRQ